MTPHDPVVSVVTPVRNEENFLDEMIYSMRNQSFASFELILVNDGSDDASPEIMREHAGEDSRLRLIRNSEHGGIVEALNRGFSECEGKYIARMDADDIAMQDRLEIQVSFMEANPDVAALGAAVQYIDADGRKLGRIRRSDVTRSILRRNPLLHPTVILRREIIEQNRLSYRNNYEYAEDYYLWLELSRFAKIATIDDVVLSYRLSDSTARARKLKAMLRATIRAKISGSLDLGIRPTPADALVLCSELFLLLMPAHIIWGLYTRLISNSRLAFG